jgi:hypothetical protein
MDQAEGRIQVSEGKLRFSGIQENTFASLLIAGETSTSFNTGAENVFYVFNI